MPKGFFKRTKEHNRKISIAKKLQWKIDKKFRERHRKGLIKAFKSKIIRKKISDKLKGKHKSLIHRKRLSKAQKNLWKNKIYRKKQTYALRKCKKNFKYIKKISKIKKQKMNKVHGNKNKKRPPFSKKWRKNISKATKGKNNPMYGKKQSKSTIEKIRNKMKILMTGKKNPFYGKLHTIKTKAKISKSVKKLFKNKEYLKKYKDGMCLKPNKAELILNKILSQNFSKDYKYVGDFQFWLGGKNPDFMNVNGQKKLIELFGNYWHKGEDPKNRIRHFKKYGFDTLVIWEKELKNILKLENRLKVFHNK